eukprot:m.258033 g.258033  ORF g.258033 m.258033 type:complete len:80 (+) comp15535_c0_seq1:594-833(+)
MAQRWQDNAKRSFQAAQHYTPERAKSYTEKNRVAQAALTQRAVHACKWAHRHEPGIILDVGCGTGLSSAVSHSQGLACL